MPKHAPLWSANAALQRGYLYWAKIGDYVPDGLVVWLIFLPLPALFPSLLYLFFYNLFCTPKTKQKKRELCYTVRTSKGTSERPLCRAKRNIYNLNKCCMRIPMAFILVSSVLVSILDCSEHLSFLLSFQSFFISYLLSISIAVFPLCLCCVALSSWINCNRSM